MIQKNVHFYLVENVHLYTKVNTLGWRLHKLEINENYLSTILIFEKEVKE